MILDRNVAKKLLYFDIFLVFFGNGLTSLFHLPGIISYVPDLLNLILVVFLLYCYGNEALKVKESTDIWILLLAAWCCVTALINVVPPLLFLWEGRNLFRFILFYYVYINLFDDEDREWICGAMVHVQLLNVALSLYQYFGLGLSQDELGGVFGCSTGVNSNSNIYFCMVTALVITRYLQRRETLFTVLWICGSSLMIAAMAEIKFFFIEFVAIAGIALLLAGPSKRSVSLAAITIICIVGGLTILKGMFPIQYDYLTGIENLLNYANMHDGGYGISRISMIEDVNDFFFQGNLFQNLFGLGLGACTMSSKYTFLTSPFYDSYGYLNYNWFSHAMLYLQTGIIGLLLYIGVIVSFGVRSLKSIRSGVNFTGYEYFCVVFSVIMVGNLMYNHWIRADVGYLAYMGFGLAFIKGTESDL